MLIPLYGEEGAERYLIEQAKVDARNPKRKLCGGEIPPRTLLVFEYGSEAAADAFLAELAEQAVILTSPDVVSNNKDEADGGSTCAPVCTHRHTIKGRVSVLAAEIAEAKHRALAPEDVHNVWEELFKMAVAKEGCMIAAGDDDEVIYQLGTTAKTFSKKNLRDRMSRSKTR